jgi:hypothetical protein
MYQYFLIIATWYNSKNLVFDLSIDAFPLKSW